MIFHKDFNNKNVLLYIQTYIYFIFEFIYNLYITYIYKHIYYND